MFKPGDIVICVNTIGLFSLTHNNRYTVLHVEEYTDGVELSNNNNHTSWYSSSRFILDIKEQRKHKLLKIKDINYEN